MPLRPGQVRGPYTGFLGGGGSSSSNIFCNCIQARAGTPVSSSITGNTTGNTSFDSIPLVDASDEVDTQFMIHPNFNLGNISSEYFFFEPAVPGTAGTVSIQIGMRVEDDGDAIGSVALTDSFNIVLTATAYKVYKSSVLVINPQAGTKSTDSWVRVRIKRNTASTVGQLNWIAARFYYTLT